MQNLLTETGVQTFVNSMPGICKAQHYMINIFRPWAGCSVRAAMPNEGF